MRIQRATYLIRRRNHQNESSVPKKSFWTKLFTTKHHPKYAVFLFSFSFMSVTNQLLLKTSKSSFHGFPIDWAGSITTSSIYVTISPLVAGSTGSLPLLLKPFTLSFWVNYKHLLHIYLNK